MGAFEFMADVLRFGLRLSLIDPFPRFKLEESGHPADLSRFWMKKITGAIFSALLPLLVTTSGTKPWPLLHLKVELQ